MSIGIDPSINRFIAGLDMIATGIRTMLGAVGPTELAALRQQTVKAFEETAKFETAVALVVTGDGTPDECDAALKLIKSRLPVAKSA